MSLPCDRRCLSFVVGFVVVAIVVVVIVIIVVGVEVVDNGIVDERLCGHIVINL